MTSEFPCLAMSWMRGMEEKARALPNDDLPACLGVEAPSAQKGEVSPQMMGTVLRHLSIYTSV